VRLRNNLLSLVGGALALVGLSGPAQATSITLTQAIASGISSLDGNFVFSNFSAHIAGMISGNTNDYLVAQLSNGFELIGPFAVSNGDVGEMLLGYTVTARPGILIKDVHLLHNGASTTGGSASVVETIFDGVEPIANLFAPGSHAPDDVAGLSADFVFGTTYSTLNVKKDIAVTAAISRLRRSSDAHISFVDQRWTFVPEPGTLLLGSVGLLGLATLGRKRSS